MEKWETSIYFTLDFRYQDVEINFIGTNVGDFRASYNILTQRTATRVLSQPADLIVAMHVRGAFEMQEIMQYLKIHGELLDSEIASGTGMSLAKVSRSVSDLSAKGEVIMCRLTRFTDGKKIEGMLCRVSGYVPPAAPGRKSKAQM